MNTKIKSITLAILGGSILFTSCQKEIAEPAQNPANTTSGNVFSSQKSGTGYAAVSLAIDPARNGASMINASDNVTAPTNSFQYVRLNGVDLNYLTGITRLPNTTTTIIGVTGSASIRPGSLFTIANPSMNATNMGNTRIGSSTGPIIYLKDIELAPSGQQYYAIQEGTRNIYVSTPPSSGALPLIWNLAATVPAAMVSSPLHGLDLYSGMLVVYGNGTKVTTPFMSTAGTCGYYAKYSMSTSGALTLDGVAATNTPYSVSVGEDAALMISDDGRFTGTFCMFATPSLSSNNYYAVAPPSGFYLPYIGNTPFTDASFTGTVANVQRNIIDYTFF